MSLENRFLMRKHVGNKFFRDSKLVSHWKTKKFGGGNVFLKIPQKRHPIGCDPLTSEFTYEFEMFPHAGVLAGADK